MKADFFSKKKTFVYTMQYYIIDMCSADIYQYLRKKEKFHTHIDVWLGGNIENISNKMKTRILFHDNRNVLSMFFEFDENRSRKNVHRDLLVVIDRMMKEELIANSVYSNPCRRRFDFDRSMLFVAFYLWQDHFALITSCVLLSYRSMWWWW